MRLSFYLATCEELSCANYATCVVINSRPTCQCPRASNCSSKRDPVCGSDGMVYLSECHMRVASCEAGLLITVNNKGVCGMLNLFFFFEAYVLNVGVTSTVDPRNVYNSRDRVCSRWKKHGKIFDRCLRQEKLKFLARARKGLYYNWLQWSC